MTWGPQRRRRVVERPGPPSTDVLTNDDYYRSGVIAGLIDGTASDTISFPDRDSAPPLHHCFRVRGKVVCG